MAVQPNITELLAGYGRGDKEALDQLMPIVYEELRRQAARYLRREQAGHTLQTTALIHEAYVRLVDQRNVQWQNRAHFFGIAAQLMRRILVDHARTKKRVKRGGSDVRVSLADADVAVKVRISTSSHGKLVAFWYNDEKGDSRWRLRVAQLDNGATVNTFDVAQTVQVQWDSRLRWSPDGRYLVYVDHSGGIDNLWGQPIEGGAPKQLTNFEDSKIFSFAWFKDGSLVASRGVITSDVVLIKDAGK